MKTPHYVNTGPKFSLTPYKKLVEVIGEGERKLDNDEEVVIYQSILSVKKVNGELHYTTPNTKAHHFWRLTLSTALILI